MSKMVEKREKKIVQKKVELNILYTLNYYPTSCLIDKFHSQSTGTCWQQLIAKKAAFKLKLKNLKLSEKTKIFCSVQLLQHFHQ